jgi:hypothetical protein
MVNHMSPPLFVAADIENDPSPFENARASILVLDLLRILPDSPLRLVVPRFELLLAIWVFLPEMRKRAPRDDSHSIEHATLFPFACQDNISQFGNKSYDKSF